MVERAPPRILALPEEGDPQGRRLGGLISFVVRPLMLKSWGYLAVLPMTVAWTLKITTPRGALFAQRMKWELWAVTLIVVTCAAP